MCPGTNLTRAVLIAVLLLGSASSWAQWEVRSADEIIEEGITTGTTPGTRPYFGDAEEQLRSIDLGQWVPRDEQGREQEVLIMVQEGERYFCAHCGDLLRDTVQFRHVSMEESVNYYDDGTHGDLIPNDGLPTRIKKIDRDYIGPRCYQHMLYLESLRERATYRDAHEAAFLGMEPMESEEPPTFFTKVKVAPMDSESRLAVDPMARFMPGAPGVEERYSFVALDDLRKQRIRQFEETVIWEFKRKPMHTDFYLHRNEIDPYVPAGASAPAVSSSAGWQPAPRRWEMATDAARMYGNRPVPY